MALTAPDALLFDIGNVIIDIDFKRAFARWAELARTDAAALRDRFSMDAPYRQHEIGAIDAAAYFASLRASLGIDLTDAQFLEGWNAIFIAEAPGISALLARAATRIPLYGFTNTNRAHLAWWKPRFADAMTHFRHVFASCEIGLRKPDAAAFAHIVREIDVPAERILFFDDTLENVEGARVSGLQAVHVRSRDDVPETLAALGLQPD